MALAVAAAFFVGLVVFFVVGHQIPQREPVVSGDEVDRRDGAASGALVEVGRSGQPVGEFVEGCRLAAPVVAHGVAVLAVPLRPLWWEVADLVAAGTDVP